MTIRIKTEAQSIESYVGQYVQTGGNDVASLARLLDTLAKKSVLTGLDITRIVQGVERDAELGP